MKDLVVLIPGIGGSALAKDGKELWSLTPGAALRGVLSAGGSLRKLTLSGDDPEADDLGDGVVATRLLPDYHVVPGLDWRIDGYDIARTSLCKSLNLTPGANFFELPYDWRRDNRVAARALARLATTRLREWRERSGAADAKLVIVAHSMGGIIARIFLEQLDGHRDTRLLITFGTPYSGSVKALDFLANGFRAGWGPFTVDLSTMLRSFTSVYQLLPSYRCLAGANGAWLNLDEVDWTGSGVDDARLRAAIGLHRELRAAVDDRLKTGASGCDVRPIIGDFQRTPWAAQRTASGVTPLFSRGDLEGGDGTVAKLSASPHELLDGYRSATFAGQKHATLQNVDALLTHASGLIRNTGGGGGVPVFPASDVPTMLEAEDVLKGEPLVVRAFNDAGLALRATATRLPAPGEPDQSWDLPLTPQADGWHTGFRDDLPEGDYRIVVSAPGAAAVSDVVSVVDLALVG